MNISFILLPVLYKVKHIGETISRNDVDLVYLSCNNYMKKQKRKDRKSKKIFYIVKSVI